MTYDAEWFGRLAPLMVRFAAALAVAMVAAVAIERAAFGIAAYRRRRFDARYRPLIGRALAGDAAAERALVRSPRRHRLRLAALLVAPLIHDRDPRPILTARRIVRQLALADQARRMLRSRRWWRRALALRGVGLLQMTEYTPAIVAALDDPNADVRAAALDALADLHDPAALHAVVVRLLDTTLHRGRRIAALAAFGAAAEPMLLDLAEMHADYRVAYARALGLCGTARAIPALCRWTSDPRPDVRAAAFGSLARVGLDDHAARLALDALDTGAPEIRAAAARALHDWTGAGDAAARLARHLDDEWIVASEAARALLTIRPAGPDALRATAARDGLAGVLARQMLWELRMGV